MPVRLIRRAWIALAVVALSLTVPLGAATAAAGTWGAGHYPYADGRVCVSGPSTQPLAAWSVSGGHRAYLTQGLSSTGRLDSGAPPIPSAGTANAASDVLAGGEFGTDQDVATFAYLVAHGGDAAAVAAAVLAQTDPGDEPSCADAAAANALIADARRHAGPYQLSVDVGPGKARVGQPITVSATVQNPSGAPVPDVRVTFAGPDGGGSAPAAVTDAQGVAHATVTIGSAVAGTATVTATASVSVRLEEATITAQRSATNPTGSSVPAVYAAPATPYSGSTTLPVDQTAHPVISTTLPGRLVRTDTPFVPRARVTGLNGHSADVSFNLLGPLPLAKGTLCGSIPASRWSDKNIRIAATTSATITGDVTAEGGELTAGEDGCYAVQTTLTTADATPAVTRKAPPAVVAVLTTSITTGDPVPAVFAAGKTSSDQLTGTSHVGDTYGLSAEIKVVLTGPIAPANGDCAPEAPAWRRAARQSVVAKVGNSGDRTPTAPSVKGAGSYTYAVPPPDQVGCYHAHPVLVVSSADGATLSVAAETETPVYVLHPTVTAEVEQTWSVTPQPVPVQVSVDGLFGLAAHVRTNMYVKPADPGGCDRVAFAGATRAAAGPAAAVPAAPGTVTVQVKSGPTPKVGCYAVVPEVTIDANPQVIVAGALGTAGSTLIAGVDPNQPGRAAAQHTRSGTGVAFVVAMTVLAALILAVVLRVGFVAWRDRLEPAGESWFTGPSRPTPGGFGLIGDEDEPPADGQDYRGPA